MPKKVLSSDIYQWELIKWRKIENIKMFLGGSQPDIDSIRQGEYIGDCFFYQLWVHYVILIII